MNDGTYDQKYQVGDTAWVTIDGNRYLFELAGKNKDLLAGGVGHAKMTWISCGAIANHRRVDSWDDNIFNGIFSMLDDVTTIKSESRWDTNPKMRLEAWIILRSQ